MPTLNFFRNEGEICAVVHDVNGIVFKVGRINLRRSRKIVVYMVYKFNYSLD